MTRTGDVVEPDTTTERLAGSAFLLVVRRIVGSGLSAVSAVVVVRSLAPDEFGQYAAGLSAYYLLVALTEFGFGEVLGRTLGRGTPDERGFGTMLLTVNVAWSGIVAVSGVLIAGLLVFDSVRGSTLLVLTPAIALAGTNALRQFFYARHEVGRMATADLSVMVVSTVAIVGLAVVGASPVLLAAATSAASAMTSLLVLRMTWQWIRRDPAAAPASAPHSAQGLLKDAFPIGLSSVLATAYVSIDVVLLSSLFPSEDVGQYASAVKVLSILTILPGVVMAVALPQLSADWNDPERLAGLLSRLWHWFMSLVMPGLAIVAANATGVMTVLFGQHYAPAGAFLGVLMIAGAVAMLSQLLGVVVVASARTHWLVWQNVIALLVNVSGNLLLAPRFGIVTAAWLTVATECIVCGGSAWVLRNRLPYAALLRVSLRPLAAVFVAVVVGLTLASTPGWALATSGVIYVVMLSLLRAWPAELISMLPRRVKPV